MELQVAQWQLPMVPMVASLKIQQTRNLTIDQCHDIVKLSIDLAITNWQPKSLGVSAGLRWNRPAILFSSSLRRRKGMQCGPDERLRCVYPSFRRLETAISPRPTIPAIAP